MYARVRSSGRGTPCEYSVLVYCLKRMQTWRASTGTRFFSSSTVQLLSFNNQSRNAATASGSDSRIAYWVWSRFPYGRGTGSATTEGCAVPSRYGANGTYRACPDVSPGMRGAKAAVTTRGIVGLLRERVRR